MTYREENRDLFSVDGSYVLAHCINAEYVLGKGIASEFEKRYNMSEKLQKKYPLVEHSYICRALKIDNVYNLVTKQFHYNKPTYGKLILALKDLRWKMIKNNETKLAIPRIGCGLDKLEWDKVRKIIHDVFDDTDIDILVCVK